MTCIVGLIAEDGIYMGADSCVSNSYIQRTLKSPKIFKKGDMLIGCSGYLRMMQLVQYSLEIPKHRDAEQSLYEYMITTFIDALRKCFKTAGYSEINNNQEFTDSVLLIGYKGSLFKIETNYQIMEYTDSFAAIGSGSEVALGALMATENEQPQQRIEKALLAAEKFSRGVKGPFNFLKMSSIHE
jgi:ATP-dependent protease HslVU (ClpYQ) peptidase subunit